MDKLKINLIPPEIKEKAKKEAKRSLIVKISVGLLGLLILFTSAILGVIIFQNAKVQTLTSDIEAEKNNVGSLKEKEAVVFFLKNRIDTIKKFNDDHYKQGAVYELVSSLVPQGISLTSIQVDKTDKVLLAGETTATRYLDVFFNNITNPSSNDGKIVSASVESLNKSQNGTIRFTLTVNMKEKAQ